MGRQIPLYPSQEPPDDNPWFTEREYPVIEGPIVDFRPVVPLDPAERRRLEQEGLAAEREERKRDALAAYIRGDIRHRLRALGRELLSIERTMQARDAFLVLGDNQGLLVAGLQCIDREYREEALEIMMFVRSSKYLRQMADSFRNRDASIAAAALAAADAIDASRL